jgi:putative membrane protein
MSEPENNLQIKKWDRIAWAVSTVVILLVVLMGRVKFDIGVTLSFLPPIHAVLNTLVAVMLVLSLLRIKKGDVAGHRRFINFALALSTVFLLCYVSYHFTTPETKFGGTGW